MCGAKKWLPIIQIKSLWFVFSLRFNNAFLIFLLYVAFGESNSFANVEHGMLCRVCVSVQIIVSKKDSRIFSSFIMFLFFSNPQIKCFLLNVFCLIKLLQTLTKLLIPEPLCAQS